MEHWKLKEKKGLLMNKISQYSGDKVYVNLTEGRIVREPIDIDTAEKFVGGAGINNKLGYELIKPGVAPLSPENVLIFGSCAISGTPAPASSRMFVTTKYPASGTIGTASGGSCGDALRLAGYGQLVITGKSESPVFLKIFDDEVEICSATDLWGKDIWYTVDELRRRYGKDCSVIAIGPTGEMLSAISLTFTNKNGHLGRGGLPAVMGSKNLKAILIRGTKGIKLADEKGFMKIVDSLFDSIMNQPYRDDWLGLGVSMGLWGKRSTWTQKSAAEEAANKFSSTEFQKTFKGFLACPTCPVSCKSVLELTEGEYANTQVPMTGVGLPMDYLGKLGLDSLHQAFALGDLCNRNGVDMLDFSALVEASVDLYKEKVITKEDTDGLELKKDYRTVMNLLNKIIHREGFGAFLADGLRAFANTFGEKAKEYIAARTVKGHEPMLDPRFHFHTWNITEMVNPRSPWGQPGNSPAFFPGRTSKQIADYLRRLCVSEDAITRICSPTDFNIARLTRYAEDFYSLCSSVGICVRIPIVSAYNPEIAAQLLAAVTGLQMGGSELMRVGERSWNIEKAANVREGFDRKDDKLPEIFFTPLETKGKIFTLKDYFGNPITRNDVERILDDYYDERGWDVKSGVPTGKTLINLGISNVIDDLNRLGIKLSEGS
jgi:aldehyde:ferredoxin oxidoreductase